MAGLFANGSPITRHPPSTRKSRGVPPTVGRINASSAIPDGRAMVTWMRVRWSKWPYGLIVTHYYVVRTFILKTMIDNGPE